LSMIELFVYALLNRILPSDESIDLLNVAFENPRAILAARTLREQEIARANKAQNGIRSCAQVLSTSATIPETYDVPDRLTGRESLSVLRQLHSKRNWNFVEIDVSYPVRPSSIIAASMYR
jgi:hypothetical protein